MEFFRNFERSASSHLIPSALQNSAAIKYNERLMSSPKWNGVIWAMHNAGIHCSSFIGNPSAPDIAFAIGNTACIGMVADGKPMRDEWFGSPMGSKRLDTFARVLGRHTYLFYILDEPSEFTQTFHDSWRRYDNLRLYYHNAGMQVVPILNAAALPCAMIRLYHGETAMVPFIPSFVASQAMFPAKLLGLTWGRANDDTENIAPIVPIIDFPPGFMVSTNLHGFAGKNRFSTATEEELQKEVFDIFRLLWVWLNQTVVASGIQAQLDSMLNDGDNQVAQDALDGAANNTGMGSDVAPAAPVAKEENIEDILNREAAENTQESGGSNDVSETAVASNDAQQEAVTQSTAQVEAAVGNMGGVVLGNLPEGIQLPIQQDGGAATTIGGRGTEGVEAGQKAPVATTVNESGVSTQVYQLGNVVYLLQQLPPQQVFKHYPTCRRSADEYAELSEKLSTLLSRFEEQRASMVEFRQSMAKMNEKIEGHDVLLHQISDWQEADMGWKIDESGSSSSGSNSLYTVSSNE